MADPLFTLFFTTLFPIALLVSLIHFLFVALMFMAGKTFMNDGLVGFAKHEFGQAIFSLVIIASVLTLIPLTNLLFCTSLQESGLYTQTCTASGTGLITAHVKVAREYLDMSYNNVRVLAKGTLRAFDWSATAAGANIGVGLTSFSPWKYQGINAYIYGECFSILYKAMLFLKFQELFMLLNALYFFPYLFCIGLVLRILPFTRKLGGLLMGITLGLFFVLPYMYILCGVVVQSTTGFDTKFVLDTSKYAFLFVTFSDIIDNSGSPKTFDDVIGEYKTANPGANTGNVYAGAAGQLAQNAASGGSYSYKIGKSGAVPNADGNAAFGSSLDYYDAANPDNHNYSLVEVVARILLAATISSIFAIAGTLAAIREISVMLGGDVEIAGLTRLI